MDSTKRYIAERDERYKLRQEQRSAIQEFLQTVGGPTTVRMGGDQSEIETRKLQGRNRNAFHATVADDASMLDVLRMAATEMFHTNAEIIDTVTRKLSDPNIGYIAKSIETARVELLGDVWFSTKMAEDTTQKKNARNAALVERGLPPMHNLHVGGAVEKAIYGLDGTIDNDVVRRAIELFKPEIRSATMTLDSTAAINIAVDIANYLKIETAKEEEPTVPVGTEPRPGDKETDGNEPQGEVPVLEKGTQQVPNVFDETTGTETPSNTLTYEAPPEVVEPTPEELKKRINRNVRSGATRRQNKIEGKNSVKSSAPQSLNTGYDKVQSELYGKSHTAISVTVPSEPTPISEYARLALQTYASSASERDFQRLHKRGQPSRHAWKLNLGNTRVFQQPPKVQGHISMLIDISSSMGCWCAQCQERVRSYGRRRGHDNAFLAWQVAATLGQLHPNAEVFAYSSPSANIGGNMQTAVYPLPAGHQPALCGNGSSEEIVCGGTPTCAAMLWFKEHLSQRPDSTTAIIITDGAPNGCGGIDSHHVELIGAEMMSMGMKFGTVFIGDGKYLNLPSEVSVNISNVEELRDIQPLLTLLDE